MGEENLVPCRTAKTEFGLHKGLENRDVAQIFQSKVQ